jgi:hypothetical protein
MQENLLLAVNYSIDCSPEFRYSPAVYSAQLLRAPVLQLAQLMRARPKGVFWLRGFLNLRYHLERAGDVPNWCDENFGFRFRCSDAVLLLFLTDLILERAGVGISLAEKYKKKIQNQNQKFFDDLQLHTITKNINNL